MAKTVTPEITFEEAAPEITFEEAGPVGPRPNIQLPQETFASQPSGASGYRMGLASYSPVNPEEVKRDTRPVISSEGENRSLLGRAGLILAGEIGGARFDNPHAGDVMTSRFLDRSPFGVVYKSLTGHPILTDEESAEHHYADLIGSIGGDLTTLSLVGKGLSAAGTPEMIGRMASGVTNPALKAIINHTVETAATFSVSGMAQNVANQRAMGMEVSPGFTAEAGMKDAAMGAALGLAGTIPSALLRTIAEVAVGGVGSKIQGATPDQMFESMAVFGLFGFLGRKNISPLERAAAKTMLEAKLSKLGKVELPAEPTQSVNVQGALDGRLIANEMNKTLDKLKIGQTQDTQVNESDLVAVGKKLKSSLIDPTKVAGLQVGAEDPTFTYDQRAQQLELTSDKAAQRASFIRAEREAAQLPVRDQIVKLIGDSTEEATQGFGLERLAERSQLLAREGSAKQESIIEALVGNAENLSQAKSLLAQYAKNSLTGQQLRSQDVRTLLSAADNATTGYTFTKAFDAVERIASGNRQRTLAQDTAKVVKRMESSGTVDVNFKDYANKLLLPHAGEGLSLQDQARLLNHPKDLYRISKQRISQLPLKDLQVLHDQMVLAEQAGRDVYKSRAEAELAYCNQVLNGMEQVGINMSKLPTEDMGWFMNKANGMYNKYVLAGMAMKPMDVLADIADGGHGTGDGPLSRQLKALPDYHYRNYLKGRRANLEASYRLIDELGFYSNWKGLWREKTIDGLPHSERILIHADRAQEGGIEKLLASGYKQEVIDSVKLTPAEMKWYQHTQENLDVMGMALENFSRSVGNKRFERVKNYFPFMSENKVHDELPVIDRFDRILKDGTPARTKTVDASMTIQRVGGAQQLNKNAFHVYHKAIDDAHYLMNMGEVIQRNWKIMKIGEKRTQDGGLVEPGRFQKIYGDVQYKIWMDYLDTLARKGGAAGQQASKTDIIIDGMRRRIGAGTLGFNPLTALMQYTSLPMGAAFIGGSWMQKGLTRVLPTEANKPYQRLFLESPELHNRVGDDYGHKEGGRFTQKSFGWIQRTDGHVALATYAGAYEKFLHEKGKQIDLFKLDPDADAYASRILRRSQSSGSFKDMPQTLSRGSLTGSRAIDRVLLQFQSFNLNLYSIYRHEILQAGITEENPTKALQMAMWLGSAHLLAGGARFFYTKIIDQLTGHQANFNDSISNRVVDDYLGTIPFVGQVADAFKFGSSPVPILGVGQDIFAASRDSKKAIRGAMRLVPGGSAVGNIAFKMIPAKNSSNAKAFPSFPSLPSLPDLK